MGKRIIVKNIIKKNTRKIELMVLLITALLLAKVDFSTDMDADFYFRKEDVYHDYLAVKQLQKGENPYDRILESNMLQNDKYATQLPLYFYFLSFIRDLAKDNFSGFVEIFRSFLFWFQLAGGLFIYLIFRRINKPFIGYCAAVFYCFNVWTLNSFIFLKQDMVAIALLLASFYFFKSKRHRWLAYILFALSLGIKHIGIFAFPLYLTPLLFKEESYKKFAGYLGLLFLTLLIPTLPLLIDNPSSFLNSMLFSVTREPFSSEILFGYRELLVKYNASFNRGTLFEQFLPRLPLLIASVLCMLLLFLKKIPPSAYLFTSIMVFTIFNPIIFSQYITWLPPLALVAFVDYLEDKK